MINFLASSNSYDASNNNTSQREREKDADAERVCMCKLHSIPEAWNIQWCVGYYRSMCRIYSTCTKIESDSFRQCKQVAARKCNILLWRIQLTGNVQVRISKRKNIENHVLDRFANTMRVDLLEERVACVEHFVNVVDLLVMEADLVVDDTRERQQS
jgi:hypothetical protein